MTKYIIKNCPSCMEYIETNSARTYCCREFHHTAYCKEYTSCLLKQIVEICKQVDCDCLIDKRKCGAMDSMSMCCELFVKKDILKLLEIEEVNE